MSVRLESDRPLGCQTAPMEAVVGNQEQEGEFNYLVFVQLCSILDAE